jgi:hypothetical protein
VPTLTRRFPKDACVSYTLQRRDGRDICPQRQKKCRCLRIGCPCPQAGQETSYLLLSHVHDLSRSPEIRWDPVDSDAGGMASTDPTTGASRDHTCQWPMTRTVTGYVDTMWYLAIFAEKPSPFSDFFFLSSTRNASA